MSEFEIKIETLTFPTGCDKCDKIVPMDTKTLTIDTSPDSVAGELVVICPECLLTLHLVMAEEI